MSSAEFIGCGGCTEGVFESAFPGLAILDTEEILEKMGKEWKIPEPYGRHVSSIDLFKDYAKKQFHGFCDQVLVGWVDFCNGALKGRDNVNKLINKGILTGDPTSIDYYLLFYHALPNESDLPKTILSIRNAFSMLLSDDLRKNLDLEKSTEEPTQETKEKINILTKELYMRGISNTINYFDQLNQAI